LPPEINDCECHGEPSGGLKKLLPGIQSTKDHYAQIESGGKEIRRRSPALAFIAANPMNDHAYYPDSDKYLVRMPEKRLLIKGARGDYFTGEDETK
jgi:hypothetical protein